MNTIKMIGFDLDGTLLTKEKTLTPRTRQALIKAAEYGIYVLPVTGRSSSGIPDCLLEMPEISYAVTANGARILEMKTGEVIYERPLALEKAMEVKRVFDDYDVLQDAYYDGIGYAEPEALMHIEDYVLLPAMQDYVVRTRRAVQNLRAKMLEEDRGVDKIQALFRYPKELEEAWKRIRRIEGIEATGALGNNIEVNAAGVDKGTAMVKLGEILGIRPEEMLAFGDGTNDLKMLQTAGCGVAMENAVPEVKAVADAVTLCNDEEGVAAYIEQYVLADL